jgi:hypothetical protein
MDQRRTAKWRFLSKHLLMLIGLGVSTLWFFRDIIVNGHILWGSDFISTYLPYKQFLYEEIQHHGSIPFWNPYLFGGMPFWAFFESTIFYPLDLLFWFVSPERAYGYTMALHILLAGFSMYALCQALHLSRSGSLLAGIVFSYNSFIMPVLFLGRMVHVQSYAWTPLILCLVVRSFESQRSSKIAICAGLCWGLQILGADPQTAFYTYGALVLFALIHYQALSSIRRCLYAIKVLGIVFAVGLGVSAVQIVPASELVRQSTRAAFKTYDMVTLGSFPPQGIVTVLFPHFFGNHYENNFWVADMPWSFPGLGLYVGILPLLLLFFVRYWQTSQSRLPLFCVMLAVISVVLAMGKHTPVYRVVYLLPGFDSFRAPAKIMVLWMLAISVLSAKGLDDLAISANQRIWRRWVPVAAAVVLFVIIDIWLYMKPEDTVGWFSAFLLKATSDKVLASAWQMMRDQFHRMTILAILGGTVIYLHFRGFIGRKIWLGLCLAILLVDIGALNYRYIDTSDTDYSNMRDTKMQLARAFRHDREVFRVGEVRSHFGPNAGMYYGLQSTGGAGPLIPHRYYLYCNQFYSKVARAGWQVLKYGTPGSEKFMDMLNVKYEIDYKQKRFWLRKNYLPRALLVPDYKVLPGSSVLSYMESDDFNPRRTVLLEEEQGGDTPHSHKAEAFHAKLGGCEILSYRPDEVLINTTCTKDSFLVLNDNHYPGWKCYVDNIPQDILRCNHLFRAIRLPRGSHKVRFLFKPPLVKIGIGITVATLLLSLVVLRANKSFRKTT